MELFVSFGRIRSSTFMFRLAGDLVYTAEHRDGEIKPVEFDAGKTPPGLQLGIHGRDRSSAIGIAFPFQLSKP